MFNFSSETWQRYSLMLVSLLIAVLLWVYVNSATPQQDQEFRVPLHVINMPEEMITEELPERVSLRVQANNIRIAGLEAGDFRAVVDFSQANLGENTLPITVSAPQGIQISQVIPSTITVNVDKLVQKQVPVQVFLRGTPQAGFTTGEPLLVPNAVLARGPSRLLDTIDQVPVTVNVEGANQNLDYSLPIALQQGQVILSPEVVRVVVPVNISVPYKSVPVRANIIGQPAEDFEVAGTTVNPAVVQIYAPGEILGTINEISTRAVNVGGIRENIKRQIELQLPEGVVLAQPNRVEVTVEVNKKPQTPPVEAPPEPPAQGD